MKTSPQEIFKLSDSLTTGIFKDYSLISWEAGFSSTERKNIARVKRALNALDELNEMNIKHDDLFYFVRYLIKDILSNQYKIKCSGNTYSIKRKVKP